MRWQASVPGKGSVWYIDLGVSAQPSPSAHSGRAVAVEPHLTTTTRLQLRTSPLPATLSPRTSHLSIHVAHVAHAACSCCKCPPRLHATARLPHPRCSPSARSAHPRRDRPNTRLTACSRGLNHGIGTPQRSMLPALYSSDDNQPPPS